MFVTDSSYLEAIKKVITSNNKQVIYLAVAFWGKGAELLFDALPIYSKVQVICNLKSGGTNPKTIRKLQGYAPQITIRQLDDLHAKVICGDKVAVIGSANCSSNGLALQGQQCAGWREAGMITKEEDVLAGIRPWLASLWQIAQEISEMDLTLAQANWDRRRAIINKEDAGRFRFDEPYGKEYWEGKRVFLAFHCSYASIAAIQEHEQVMQQLNNNTTTKHCKTSTLDFYENWPTLPKEAVIISVYYKQKSKQVEVAQECYCRIPALDVKHFMTEENQDSSLQIVQTIPYNEFQFGPQEAKAIEAKLNQTINGKTRAQSLWSRKPKGKYDLVIPFSELL